MGGMTETTETVAPWWRTRTVAALAAIALVVLAVWGFSARAEAQRQATMTDVFYCTLSGVGPFDRGPETGRMCADLLYDD